MADETRAGRLFPYPESSWANKEFTWRFESAIEERAQSALNIGAHQCSRMNPWPCDTLDVDQEPDRTRDLLKEYWGITNTVESRQTVGRLLDGMHSATYEVVFPLVSAAISKTEGHTSEAHRDYLALRAYSRQQSPDHWVGCYDALNQLRTTVKPFAGLTHPAWPEHIRAWDFARLPYVVRATRNAGYLDDDECWPILHANLEAARGYYPNWRQFAHGLIVGRMFWRALTDINTATEYGQTAADAVNALLVRPDSPWRRLPLHPTTT
jgi:hypothetical protein